MELYTLKWLLLCYVNLISNQTKEGCEESADQSTWDSAPRSYKKVWETCPLRCVQIVGMSKKKKDRDNETIAGDFHFLSYTVLWNRIIGDVVEKYLPLMDRELEEADSRSILGNTEAK